MPTPMLHSYRHSPTQGAPLSDADASDYCHLISCLLYLTNTRPDITFSVNNLSQFVKSPTKEHQQASFHILRYLKVALGSGIFFHSSNFIQLRCFSDSDWETCPTTRKSITGFSIFLSNSFITLKSKKKQTISRSSSEVEYSFMQLLHVKSSGQCTFSKTFFKSRIQSHVPSPVYSTCHPLL